MNTRTHDTASNHTDDTMTLVFGSDQFAESCTEVRPRIAIPVGASPLRFERDAWRALAKRQGENVRSLEMAVIALAVACSATLGTLVMVLN